LRFTSGANPKINTANLRDNFKGNNLSSKLQSAFAFSPTINIFFFTSLILQSCIYCQTIAPWLALLILFEGMEGDSLRLDRERQQFSHSPPPYTSNPSGTTTRSASPNSPSEEQRLRQERRMQLEEEREASEPHEQFAAQVEEEGSGFGMQIHVRVG
jgi:hypothetical protein